LTEITTLFWDIGGVILTNGWDRGSRRDATTAFQLDWEEFEDRHDLSFPAFDAGQITLNEYLDRTLFYRTRPFTTERYFIGAINNEPLELNEYRIQAFHLRRDFLVFFSSCYVHSRKPEEHIFRVALEVTQRKAEECVFIDDRPLNLESPRRLGMNAIHYQNPEQLCSDLAKLNIKV